jgi:K+ transporter
LFGIIPNEWLTYTQAEWEWTDQKLWIQIPTSLLGGNEVNISASAFKDIIAAGYVTVVTGALAAVMIAWQKRDEIIANRAKKKAAEKKVSVYGRPLQKVEK